MTKRFLQLLLPSAVLARPLTCYMDEDGPGDGSTCKETSLVENFTTYTTGQVPTERCDSDTHSCVELIGTRYGANGNEEGDWYVGGGCVLDTELATREAYWTGWAQIFTEREKRVKEFKHCKTDLCNGPCWGDVLIMIIIIVVSSIAGCCCCCCAAAIFWYYTCRQPYVPPVPRTVQQPNVVVLSSSSPSGGSSSVGTQMVAQQMQPMQMPGGMVAQQQMMPGMVVQQQPGNVMQMPGGGMVQMQQPVVVQAQQ